MGEGKVEAHLASNLITKAIGLSRRSSRSEPEMWCPEVSAKFLVVPEKFLVVSEFQHNMCWLIKWCFLNTDPW